MDAESNETTPVISVPLLHEDIYIYIRVFMYNIHMIDKIILQVSRNVHIMIRETITYMTMDVTHNETNPTITFHISHEDSDVHSTHISRKTSENIHRRI